MAEARSVELARRVSRRFQKERSGRRKSESERIGSREQRAEQGWR